MTVHQFPVTAATMTDDELGFHQAGAMGKLLAENVDLEIDREIFRAAWLAATSRLEAFQLRRLRFAVCGAIAGALVAWCLDGSAAQKLNALLNLVGWHA